MRPDTQEEEIVDDTPADLEGWVHSVAAALGIDPEEVPIGLLLDVTARRLTGSRDPLAP